MKKLSALLIVTVVGISMAASAAFAAGDCSGKAAKPIKDVTQSDTVKSGSG